MSNGKLAQLPPENMPGGISMPEEPSIMLLLPHNKYLLGTSGTSEGKWIYASVKPDEPDEKVYLYENEDISLQNEGTRPIIIPADTVNILRRQLFRLTSWKASWSKGIYAWTFF